MSGTGKTSIDCECCGASTAHQYAQYFFSAPGLPAEERIQWLCVKCARQRRKTLEETLQMMTTPADAYTRDELIALMDRFWEESGALSICARCHAQGTGCCPPMCRHLSASGCRRKNVFCTSFICSALLNAITECDADTGRLLKWVKQNPGATEFRLYEMVTRVPASDQDDIRPLTLPKYFPGPLALNAAAISAPLAQLADEVLEIRRRWHNEEQRPFEK